MGQLRLSLFLSLRAAVLDKCVGARLERLWSWSRANHSPELECGWLRVHIHDCGVWGLGRMQIADTFVRSGSVDVMVIDRCAAEPRFSKFLHRARIAPAASLVRRMHRRDAAPSGPSQAPCHTSTMREGGGKRSRGGAHLTRCGRCAASAIHDYMYRAVRKGALSVFQWRLCACVSARTIL